MKREITYLTYLNNHISNPGLYSLQVEYGERLRREAIQERMIEKVMSLMEEEKK